MKHGYSLGFTWFTALFFTVVWAQGQTDILWGLNYPQDSSYTLANVFKTGNTGAGYSQLDTFPLNYPGYNPGYSAPVQTANGKLYGVLASGGYNSNFVINGLTGGAGVIYSFDTGTLAYSIVHTFSGYDGAYPWGSLLKASDGKLYGMCEYGTVPGPIIFRVMAVFSVSTPLQASLKCCISLTTLTALPPGAD